MTVGELARRAGYRVLAGGNALQNEITSGYAGDLLSWVMAHGKRGTAWVTVQTHLNVIAVATLHEFSCVILPEGIAAPEETLSRAQTEGIPVLSSDKSAYGVCRDLHALHIPEV